MVLLYLWILQRREIKSKENRCVLIKRMAKNRSGGIIDRNIVDFGRDVIRGYHTVLPIPLAEAASFHIELIEKAYRAVAEETTSDGIQKSIEIVIVLNIFYGFSKHCLRIILKRFKF